MQKENAEKRYDVTYFCEESYAEVKKATIISIEANWMVLKDSVGHQFIINGARLIEMEEV